MEHVPACVLCYMPPMTDESNRRKNMKNIVRLRLVQLGTIAVYREGGSIGLDVSEYFECLSFLRNQSDPSSTKLQK